MTAASQNKPSSNDELKARIEELEGELARARHEEAALKDRIDELEGQALAESRRESPRERREVLADTQVIAVLLDLHRATMTPTATLRGKGANESRYLAAARCLGDELADAILPPAKG